MDIDKCFTIGLGTWNFSGIQYSTNKKLGWPEIDLEEKHEIIYSALKLGINFFDTSDFYGIGKVESLLGKTLMDRKDVFIATKGGLINSFDNSNNKINRCFTYSYISEAIEKSKERLQRKKIDLYQLHGPNFVNIIDNDLWKNLEKEIVNGNVGMFGVSLQKNTINEQTINNIINNPLISTVQLPSNLISNYLIFGEKLKENGKIVIGRSPFLHGLLLKENLKDLDQQDPRNDFIDSTLINKIKKAKQIIDKFKMVDENAIQFILKYIISSNCFDFVLVGASKNQQLVNIFKKKIERILSKDQFAQIEDEILKSND